MRRRRITEHIGAITDNAEHALVPLAELDAMRRPQSPAKPSGRTSAEEAAGLAQRNISKRELGFGNQDIVILLHLVQAVRNPGIIHRGSAGGDLVDPPLIGGGLVAFVFVMLAILSALLCYAYYRKKKQRTHPTFAKTMTPQEKAKLDERQEHRETVAKQRRERRDSFKKQRKAIKAEEEAQKKDEAIKKRLLDESINNESIVPMDDSDTEGGSFAEKQVDI